MLFHSQHVLSSNNKEWVKHEDSFFGSSLHPSVNNHGNEIDFPDGNINSPHYIKMAKSHEKCSLSYTECSTFLGRFVNIMLQSTGLKDYRMREAEDSKTITVDIEVTRETLDLLQKVGQGEQIPFSELDGCFTTLFKPTSYFQGSSEINFSYIYVVVGLVTCSGFFFLVYKLSILKIALLIYIIAIGFNIWSQYEHKYAERILALEKNLAENGKLKIPKECFPTKLSLSEYIRYFFSSKDQCKEYMDLSKPILSDLNFSDAFSNPFLGIVLSVIPSLGNAYGKSMASFSSHIPFPINYILLLLLPSLFIIHGVPHLLGYFSLGSFSHMFYRSINVHSSRAHEGTAVTQPIYNLTIHNTPALPQPSPLGHFPQLQQLPITSSASSSHSIDRKKMRQRKREKELVKLLKKNRR